MATTPKRAKKGKRSTGASSGTKKAARTKSTGTYLKHYDAQKYAGTVPAFASVVAEEMKQWRDDR